MYVIYSPDHQVHNPSHELYDGRAEPYAERPERAESIIAALRRSGKHHIARPRRFPLLHIYRVHQRQYVACLRKRTAALPTGTTLHPSYFLMDTYTPLTPGTFTAARTAVDVALTGAQYITGRSKAIAYSLCRPPGHHAEHAAMGGYCYFNNAAIAAEFLAVQGKVAILDIDFHHGNGTQHAFYGRSDVLYVSLHADPVVRFPYSSGFADEQGNGAGLGYNHNYPLPLGTGDDAYMRALGGALAAIESFQPAYLVVSAGFDGYKHDPIGGFALTIPGYHAIGKRIAALQLPTLLIQEGGYHIADLGALAGSFLDGFTA